MFREVLHDLFSLNKSLTVHDFALFAEEDLAYAQTVLATSPPPPTTPLLLYSDHDSSRYQVRI